MDLGRRSAASVRIGLKLRVDRGQTVRKLGRVEKRAEVGLYTS
jgi:hypothetical protein